MSKVLATDLDGTLIPLADEPENARDLTQLAEQLSRQKITLIFVTGRHLASVQGAIEQFSLPGPDWMICDVGTSIYHWKANQFELVPSYAEHLQTIVGDQPPARIRERLSTWQALRLQEEEKQGRFKLSYYCDADQLQECEQALHDFIQQDDLPYGVIASIDPFDGVGLIDLLPKDASKAYALKWWTGHIGHAHDQTIFAGDSGNDLAAMLAGYRTIVVGNASRSLGERVQTRFRETNQLDRLYLAQHKATSGVLEGCRHFGWL